MTPKNGNGDASDQNSSSAGSAGEERAALIARRAYEKWQARGCPQGDDGRDWFEAEQEVLAASTAQPKGSERAPSRKRV